MLAHNSEDSEQMKAERFRRTKPVTVSRAIALPVAALVKVTSVMTFAFTSNALTEMVTP